MERSVKCFRRAKDESEEVSGEGRRCRRGAKTRERIARFRIPCRIRAAECAPCGFYGAGREEGMTGRGREKVNAVCAVRRTARARARTTAPKDFKI